MHEAIIWKHFYNKLESFYEQFGHCDVPKTQNLVLADWVDRQRRLPHRLTNLQFHLLRKLGVAFEITDEDDDKQQDTHWQQLVVEPPPSETEEDLSAKTASPMETLHESSRRPAMVFQPVSPQPLPKRTCASKPPPPLEASLLSHWSPQPIHRSRQSQEGKLLIAPPPSQAHRFLPNAPPPTNNSGKILNVPFVRQTTKLRKAPYAPYWHRGVANRPRPVIDAHPDWSQFRQSYAHPSGDPSARGSVWQPASTHRTPMPTQLPFLRRRTARHFPRDTQRLGHPGVTTQPLRSTNKQKPAAAAKRCAQNGKHQENWLQMLERLKTYKEAHGDCRVPFHYLTDPKLGTWVNTQRSFNKQGTLLPSRQKLLDELGFVWRCQPSDKEWYEYLCKLRDFRLEHGHCNVPARSDRYKGLREWLFQQWKKHKKEGLSQTRHKALKQVMGFHWQDP